MEEKYLFIIRGLPGAGKSTASKLISPLNSYSNDDWFYIKYGYYNWNVHDLKEFAIPYCQNAVKSDMQDEVNRIAVNNVFSSLSDMQYYIDIAKEYNYKVVYLIVENRNNTNTIHNVPKDTMIRMEKKFNIKLR